jgi:hypothetical protein
MNTHKGAKSVPKDQMADREGLPALRSGQAKMARGARLM